MAVLTTLDTVAISGAMTGHLGSATTTPNWLQNLTLMYYWVPNSGSSGNVTIGLDFFLSDGTWMAPTTLGNLPSFVFDSGNTIGNHYSVFNGTPGLLIQGVRPDISSVSTVNGTLKVELRMLD